MMPPVTTISPLGPRNGPGSFDTFFDIEKYESMEASIKANDYVVVDFVRDQLQVKYFQAYHIQNPKVKRYEPLMIQHFPFGIDMRDDMTASILAVSLFK